MQRTKDTEITTSPYTFMENFIYSNEFVSIKFKINLHINNFNGELLILREILNLLLR